jgi:FkbM family methyltransferase
MKALLIFLKVGLRMANSFKRILKKFFRIAGFEIHIHKLESGNENEKASLYNLMNRIKKIGLRPKTIFDVGVASGTHDLYQTFPDAHFILIEPLEECLPYLQTITKNLSNSEYILAVATSFSGKTTINVHPDIYGSSLYKEDEDSDVNGVERLVSAVTIDDICREKGTVGPYLIKVDTQGSELDVLKGAGTILPETEMIILETSLFEFFKGGPQLNEVISFMKELGFMVYDIFNLQYRLLDGAMSQVDVAFVREKGIFRHDHRYATREQRTSQNKAFRDSLTT